MGSRLQAGVHRQVVVIEIVTLVWCPTNALTAARLAVIVRVSEFIDRAPFLSS
jgi:hypothetical protein